MSNEAKIAKQAQRDYDEGLITKEDLDRLVRHAELVKRVTKTERKGAN